MTHHIPMQEDERCCGTGTCIIDAEGRCWCGQQWNGHAMCFPTTDAPASTAPLAAGTATTSSKAQDAR